MSKTEEGQIVTSKVANTPNAPKKLKYIKNKIKYNRLIGMIKNGHYTNTMLVAKALDVDFKTIRSWLNTDKVQEVAQQEIGRYVQKMETAGKKDWKMWHTLLKYTINENDNKENTGTVNNIVVYNQGNNVGVSIGDTGK